MFWIFIIFAGLAIVFAKLGAISVWVTVLKVALFMALITVAVLVAVLLWRHVFHRQ